jgi:deoxyribodipyrimidine photolyase
MTDQQSPTSDTPEMGSPADDTYAWSDQEQSQSDRAEKAREWLAQLQAMIENLATQAAPVVRQVGAKAAELAAIAGDKAGPVAQRAAEITGQAGTKLAERSRDLAAELRRDAEAAKAAGEGHDEAAEDVAEPTSTGAG